MPSTVIQSFTYRPESEELIITFTTGRRYIYADVPAEAARRLGSAFSKGIHFNRFNGFLEKVQLMRLSDMYLLCSYFEIDPHKMFQLVDNQHNATKKGTRKK